MAIVWSSFSGLGDRTVHALPLIEIPIPCVIVGHNPSMTMIRNIQKIKKKKRCDVMIHSHPKLNINLL